MEDKSWIIEPTGHNKIIWGVTGARVTSEDLPRIAAWCNGTPDIDAIAIKTPYGVQFAEVGDWILKAPDGTFRVATNEQLGRSYDKVKP